MRLRDWVTRPLRGLTALAALNGKLVRFPPRGISEKDVLWGGLGSSITPSDCQFLYFCARMRFTLERNLIRLRFYARLALLVQTLFPKHMVQYVIQTVKLDESHMAG